MTMAEIKSTSVVSGLSFSKMSIEEASTDASKQKVTVDAVNLNIGAASASAFSFFPLQPKFESLEKSEAKELLKKWNVDSHIVGKIRYEQYLDMSDEKQVKAFMLDLFNSDALQSNFSKGGYLGKVKSVDFEPMRCKLVTMSLFDKLTSNGVVYESGAIKKCLEDYYDDVPVADELRKALIVEDSDNYSIFTDEEREELLFKLLQHFVVGGPYCQYEDNVQPYFDLVKGLYKDLLCVRKSKASGDIEVASSVYRVFSVEGDQDVFSKRSKHNLFFLCVDPVKRHVNVYYYAYTSFW